MSALRDFGVLQGAVKKRIAPAYLPISAFAYLAFYFKQHQPSGTKLVELPDWQLFFLPREGVERFNVLSRKFARQDIHLVLDGAPNRRCSALALPNNFSLLFLPPYSPELKPKEISGMKSAKKSSRTTPSNQSMLCAPNSSRRSSTSNAIPKP